jgi:hypothetical protein
MAEQQLTGFLHMPNGGGRQSRFCQMNFCWQESQTASPVQKKKLNRFLFAAIEVTDYRRASNP